MSNATFTRTIIAAAVALIVLITTIGAINNHHEALMAKAGLQQCLVDGQVLWQKECGK